MAYDFHSKQKRCDGDELDLSLRWVNTAPFLELVVKMKVAVMEGDIHNLSINFISIDPFIPP